MAKQNPPWQIAEVAEINQWLEKAGLKGNNKTLVIAEE